MYRQNLPQHFFQHAQLMIFGGKQEKKRRSVLEDPLITHLIIKAKTSQLCFLGNDFASHAQDLLSKLITESGVMDYFFLI